MWIICSQYNGCWPGLVKPENGWVFDPLDIQNFLETLNTAWDKRDQWKAMGEKSKGIVADFSPVKIANQIYNSCEQVIK